VRAGDVKTQRIDDRSLTHLMDCVFDSLVAFVDFVGPYPSMREVLELCGGEMKALSSIELRKRIDLQQ
jgi:hypothetical protein